MIGSDWIIILLCLAALVAVIWLALTLVDDALRWWL
ncbi:hypothetical protein P775_09760 [Puniceibacterium antarcticum]|uniref:Uncharacterized protein n=1 Tax=Puniceibacterium antarcticum TaxID=1206336 RepID=A0A2G8RFQ8_9RHOB|nr:hypothetical protein P775_09760 [Puniceibacterium antarcticum]